MPIALYTYQGARIDSQITTVLRDKERLEDCHPILRIFMDYPRWDWGVANRGAHQLALALLLECVTPDLAIPLAAAFASQVVSMWEPSGFTVTRSQILAWVTGYVEAVETQTYGPRG